MQLQNLLVGLFVGDPLLGEPLEGDLIGELSLSSLPARVFCTASFSLNFFNGSFLSSFSSSAGVY